MEISRRSLMQLAGGGAVLALTPTALISPALANSAVAQAISAFADGATPAEGKITLTTPEIAENGNTVPVSFEVESDMTAESYVQDVLVLADGNPNPGVATFHFTPLSGVAAAATRVRLAKTQNLIVVAKMNDGKTYMAQKTVKVTIGGCGG